MIRLNHINRIDIKRILLISTILLSSISIPHSLCAKDYRGKVIDRWMNTPVAGVSVKFTYEFTPAIAVTDSNGRFVFSDVPVRFSQKISSNQKGIVWHTSGSKLYVSMGKEICQFSAYNLTGNRIFNCKNNYAFQDITIPLLTKGVYLFEYITTGGNRVVQKICIPYQKTKIIDNSVQSTNSLKKSTQTESVSITLTKDDYQEAVVNFSNTTVSSAIDTTVVLTPKIGDYVFNDDTIRSYHLSMTNADFDTLMDISYNVQWAYPEPLSIKKYLPAHLSFEGHNYGTVSLSNKGNYGIFRCISQESGNRSSSADCLKMSYKVDIDRNNKNNRLWGLKKLNLHSMSDDPTKMRDHLSYKLYNDFGIPASRTAFAKLYINNRYLGLFCAVEEIDGRFLSRRFGDNGDGNLYKEIWPSNEITKTECLTALQTNNDANDNPDVSQMMNLSAAIRTADSTTFKNLLSNFIDFEYFTKYIIVDRATGNWDGPLTKYSWWGAPYKNHNYYWFTDTKSGKFIMIPWDMEKALAWPERFYWLKNAPDSANGNTVPNWNVIVNSCQTYTASHDGDALQIQSIECDPFLKLLRKETMPLFKKEGKIFLDSLFTVERLQGQIDMWSSAIDAAVLADTTLVYDEWKTACKKLRDQEIKLFRDNFQLMVDTTIVK
jgi:hypothetical protein